MKNYLVLLSSLLFLGTVPASSQSGCNLSASITSQNNVSCFSSTTGSASVTASSGTTPYSYSWSNGASAFSISNLSAGNYSVTVTDANGCIASAVASITQPGQVGFSFDSIVPSCPGGNNGSASILTINTVTFNCTGAIQHFTVPTGLTTLSITIAGGEGGSPYPNLAGPGAVFTGICNVIPGEILSVVAASSGDPSYGISGCGGGGGSFVYDSTTLNLLAVAGGGGGTGEEDNFTNGGPGGTDLVNNTVINQGYDGTDGTGGNGGGVGDTSSTIYGGGGAGWYSNGANGFAGAVSGGNDRANGFAPSISLFAKGGFGGGGSAGYDINGVYVRGGGGGGGGYNGGGGGEPYYYVPYLAYLGSSGDGGSSFLNGTLAGTATATNYGNGFITLNYTSGGTLPYTYSWSDTRHQTTETATGLSAGTYTIILTDARGCTATNTVIIPASIINVATSIISNVSCNGLSNGSCNALGSGEYPPYTYFWSPGGATATTISNLSAGTYTITFTDNHGCISAAPATITQPAVITIGISFSTVVNVSCMGGIGSATASPATGGASPYTYSWSSGKGTNLSATGLSAGTYTFSVTDNKGCTASASVAITQPLFGLTIPAPSTTSAGCNVSGTATAAPTGGTSPYTYSWSNSQTNSQSTGLNAGTYTISATDNHGCTATNSVIVNNLYWNLYTTSVNIICNGGTGSATALVGGSLANSQTFGYTGVVEHFTVPPSITTIKVSLAGGQGGGGATLGGPGASFSGMCMVIPGDVLSVVAGGEGVYYNVVQSGADFQYAGGGGGSFVYDSNVVLHSPVNTIGLLAVAAGGGGGLNAYNSNTGVTYNYPGAPGGTDLITNATTNSSWGNAAGGIGGNAGSPGGGAYTGYFQGGGGGGWLTSTPTTYYGGSGEPTDFTGGDGGGAFGGGGGNYDDHTAGGGGGYNGGGGGIAAGFGGGSGGGAGSYLNGVLIGSPLTNNAGDGSVTISWSNVAGLLPYTYSWSTIPVQTTQSATGLGVGTYTLTVKDNSGCSAITTVIITQPASLGISILSSSNVTCKGGTAGITANAASGGTLPYTYSWSPAGGSNLAAAGISAGTYTITATDYHGCTATASANITQPSSMLGITLFSVTNVLCNGGTGSASANAATGGTLPYTYSWSGSGETNLATPALSAGNYTITVTDNHGCTANAVATITQPASALGISISSVTNVPCYGASGQAIANNATGGTSPYTYSWTGNGGTNLASSQLSAGTYTLSVTDNHGCTVAVFTTITQPQQLGITVASITNICSGGNNGSASVLMPIDTTYNYNGVVQHFQIPAGLTTLSITVAGGQGGSGYSDNDGPGAVFTAICNTIPGNILSIVASSSGDRSFGIYGGGGGGGSFVFDSNTVNLLAVAGGGGGTGSYYPYFADINPGGPGGTDLINNTVINAGYDGVDGSGGNGGGVIAIGYPSVGAGGAGWYSNGANVVTGLLMGGNDRVNGFAAALGAAPLGSHALGGYGGGGGGAFIEELGQTGGGGGGGGGFNGGGGGSINLVNGYLIGVGGDGGASYLNGTLVGSAIATNLGNGYVTLKYNYGGTAPYTYSWSDANHQTTATASGLSAGTYTLALTDAHGCSTSTTATITQSAAAISISASVSNISCNGANNGSSIVNVSGGSSPFTYSWSTGATTSSITGLSAGTYSVLTEDATTCAASASVTITQSISLIASASIISNVDCNGSANGSSNVSASGGTSPYQYSWSNGITTSSVSGLSAGNYSVTITDANSCLASASISISQPANPLSAIASASASVFCNGGNNGSGNVNASGGTAPYTCSWSPSGGSSASATGLTAGTYTITVTDNHGCSELSYVTITQLNTLVAAASVVANIACNGNKTGSGQVNASGGTSPYTYSWSTGAATASINLLGIGSYSVTVRDNNGCTATASLSITQPNALTVSAIVSSNVLCNGNNTGSGSASANNGTSPYTYSWSNGVTTASLSGLTAGTYSITVYDINGCNAIASTTITQPASPVGITIASITNINCNGSGGSITANSATGGTSPYTYSWSAGGGTNLSVSISAGTYTITVTDNHGCSAMASATITQLASAIGISIASTSNVTCYGGQGTVSANAATGGTSPYTYSWSGGAGTSLSASVSSGTYTITVTDNHGCSAIASATITQPVSVLGMTISSVSNVSCNGGSGTIAANGATGGTAPYTYSWSGGAGTSLSVSVSAGTYTITVTDNHGCSAIASATITQPISALGITVASATNVSCNGGRGSIAANAATGGTSPYTYSWSGGAGTSLSASVSAGTYTITVTDNHGCSAIASATITQPISALGITVASATNVSCNGGRGSIAANAATGGTSPYTYSWSGGAGTSLSASVSSGTYTITVTDNHGCSAITSATITQPISALGITIASATNVSCTGGRGILSVNAATGGTSPYTYSWSGGAGTSLSASVSAGTYTVTVTDNHGCSAIASSTITQPTSLGITIHSVSNVSCNGGRGSITANMATGGTSPYTYSWSGGAGTGLSASVSAGTYTITVTDKHACNATTSASVTQPASPLTVSAAVSANVNCYGGSNGIVNASASGGTSAYTYSWSNGTTKSSASGLSAGTFSVTITDAHGCSTTARVTISQPSAILLTTSIVNISACQTNTGKATVSASGGTSPYSYKWSSNTGSKTTATVSGLSSGTYTVVVTDSHGCTATVSAIITKAAVLSATKTITDVSCHGNNNGTASVSVSGGTSPYTYRWSNTRATASITGLSAGTYTLTITDASGCTLTESAIITQPAAALSVTTVDLGNVSCNGGGSGSAEGIASGGTSPYTYRWSNSKTTSTITGLSAGTYTITLSDTHGCTATASVKITQPAILRDSIVTSTCVKSLITATVGVKGGTSPYTYSWSICGGTKATMTGLLSGTYVITVTDKNGCTSTIGARLSCKTDLDSPVDSIGSGSKCCPDAIDNINLYPNPNNGQFTISGMENGMIVEIYDYTGKRINVVNTNGENMQINIYNQANGLYLIRILDKNGNLVSEKKIIKSK